MNYSGLGSGTYPVGNYDGLENFSIPISPLNLNFGSNAPIQMGNTRSAPGVWNPAAAMDGVTEPGTFSQFTDSLRKNGVIGSTDTKTGMRTDGWGGLALSTAGGLFNAYMGMKQYGLAKKQLSFQKDAFERNYASQRTSLNTQLEDRQRARVASNAGAYQSVGDYMAKNRIA